MPSIGRAAFAEFLGTLGLVFIGAAAVLSGSVGLDATGIALASGFAVAVMMVMTLEPSGAHLSPAVTIGVLLVKRIDALTAAVYIVVQLLGAAVGALLLRALLPGIVYDAARGGVPTLAPGYGVGKALTVEALITLLWVVAYLATTGNDRDIGPGAPGVAIGLLVVAGTLAFAPYTGAAFNPARWFGPAFASGHWTNAIVWTVGPLVGGIAGAVAHIAMRPAGQADEIPNA